jgi:glycolate oxidase iron-sulfur subunit
LVPDKVTAATLPEFSPVPREGRKGRVGLVGGCVMSVMFGDTNRNTVRLLNAAGYEVVIPPEQGCCGALFAHGGNLDAARESARQNIAAFERHELDAIIINAAGCGSTLKEYGHLLHDDPRWAERAAGFAARVKDVTEWLAEAALTYKKGGFGRVTYHDACHLAHAQRITKPPRELVKAVAGRDFVELPESDVCCGSAGSYNLTEPEMAARLQRRKIEHVLSTGADTVVTSNPGCLLQIQAGLTKAGGRPIRVLHIVDFLAEALVEKPVT